MNNTWIGMAIIPALGFLALAMFAAYSGVLLLWNRARGNAEPTVGQRVFAYQVTSIAQDSEMRADKLLGSVFVEHRDMGERKTFHIEFGHGDSSVLGMRRLPGSGRWMGHGRPVEWDEETVEAMGPQRN